MNKNVLGLLAGVFVLLLVIATQPYWKEYLEISGLNQSEKTESVTLPTDITLIQVGQRDEEPLYTLTLEDSQWRVNEYLADQDQVDAVLADLRDLDIDSVVSTNPDKFASYGASDSATILSVSNNQGQSREIYIGTNGIQPGSIYVRPVDEATVYLVNSDLSEYAFQSVDAWRDKFITQVSQDKVETITVTRNGRTITLQPNDQGQWQASLYNDTRIVGEVAIERFFDALDPLEGVGFADGPAQNRFNYGYRRATLAVDYADESEPTELLLVEDTEYGVWLVRNNTGENVFTIPSAIGSVLIDNTFTLFE